MHDVTKTHLSPTEVAPDTFLIHDHQGEGESPVLVGMNSMLIRAAEPVVIDTGVASNRARYLEDVFSLVDAEDVRWIFLSHDDVDHTGNVNVMMDLCPNATLVLNWFMAERMGRSLEAPPTRWRWVGDGESFDVGDRVLHAVRPPIFDSPTTRGLFDPTTGVYWASDTFGTPMPHPVVDVAELDMASWLDGMAMFDRYVSPWVDLVDHDRYQRTVDRVAELEPSVVLGCHTPVVRGANVAHALANVRRVPGATVPPQPDQTVLEGIQASFTAVV